MYISYSGFKLAKCMAAYYYRYIGKVEPPKPMNRVHMLYGDTVGNLFEQFYEQQLWKTPDKVEDLLADLVKPTMTKIVKRETQKGGVFDWEEPRLKKGNRSLEEVEQEVRDTIPRGLQIIKQHRLVSRDAAAEVKLDMTVKNHRIGGRADFVMSRIQPHEDLVIVDGKGSRWRDAYTNERQLRWYAMLYWLKHGVIPDNLGFLYWRYEGEESMDWFTVSKEDLEALLQAVLSLCDEVEIAKKDLAQIRDKNDPSPLFMPNPSADCKLCDYLPLCDSGNRYLSSDVKNEMSEGLKNGVEEGGVSF